jgi:hypothetical protein
VSSPVAIVTGASSGIGRATARLFATCGHRVVLAARRAAELEEVCVEIAGGGGEALLAPVDLPVVRRSATSTRPLAPRLTPFMRAILCIVLWSRVLATRPLVLAWILLAACGARTDLDGGAPDAPPLEVDPGCASGEVTCGLECCDGLCADDVCETVQTVEDCERYTPDAKALAVVAATAPGLFDYDTDSIAVDGGYAYYISEATVMRVPVGGGPAEAVMEPPPGDPARTSLIVNGGRVFFDWAAGLYQAPVGGDAMYLGRRPGLVNFDRRLALSASHLFALFTDLHTGTVFVDAFPLDGAPMLTLGSFPGSGAYGIAAGADVAYAAAAGGVYRARVGADLERVSARFAGRGPDAIALDGSDVYFGAVEPHRLVRMAGDGSTEDVADGAVSQVAIDDRWVFVNGGLSQDGVTYDGALYRVDKATHEVTRMAETGSYYDDDNWSWIGTALAIDEDRIYFMEFCFATDRPHAGELRLVTLGKTYAAPTPNAD